VIGDEESVENDVTAKDDNSEKCQAEIDRLREGNEKLKKRCQDKDPESRVKERRQPAKIPLALQREQGQPNKNTKCDNKSLEDDGLIIEGDNSSHGITLQ